MGWASAGAIFDPIAQALIDLDASDDIKRGVLGPLISALQDGDWDTEDESMDEFRHDPVIVELFRQKGIGRHLWDSPARVGGELDYTGSGWVLHCDDCPRSEFEVTAEDTIAGHDGLVRVWAAHLKDQHGGDGEVDETLLIDQDRAYTAVTPT